MITLVADYNVFVTIFLKDSIFNEVAKKNYIELFSPEITLEHIKKHSSAIIKRTGISKQEFQEKLTQLSLTPLAEYKSFIFEIQKALERLPRQERELYKNSIDYLALSYKLKCPLWSDNKDIKKQNIIEVIATPELIELI